jgi:hypothetical protein
MSKLIKYINKRIVSLIGNNNSLINNSYVVFAEYLMRNDMSENILAALT